ncbi:unnamed protein product [Trifolium pratense]|uniref:Uncharacterized protein n=1 Tax=Trifolium pratense TaxID=57577 RepID=A0ACB0JY98_TRIPR|nr:unnamed protein product [Trifolium pratense]
MCIEILYHLQFNIILKHLEMKVCNEEGYLESDVREKRANMNQGQPASKTTSLAFQAGCRQVIPGSNLLFTLSYKTLQSKYNIIEIHKLSYFSSVHAHCTCSLTLFIGRDGLIAE